MASAWPWLAVAALGALHGLNPATGWLVAAAWASRAGDRSRALRALAPIAVGHTASIAIVAAAFALGSAPDRALLQGGAIALLAALAAFHLAVRGHRRRRVPTGSAGLALWSFAMATGHGAGWMLVPALLPLCAGGPGRGAAVAAGPLGSALAAVAVHTASMLVACGVATLVACRAAGAARLWWQARQRLAGHIACRAPARVRCAPETDPWARAKPETSR